MTLDARAKAAISASMREAPHGERGPTAERLAAAYGVSKTTIYRVAQVGGTKRRRAPARPEYREWTRRAVWLAHRAPKRIPLHVAIEAGIESGLLPPEAEGMPVATARRLAREMGLGARQLAKRTHRLHADYPMQAVQIDGSSSEHLVVAEDLGGGEYLLKLHRRPYSASGYKNKPLPASRLRVLIYAMWDMCTGYVISRYVVAKGEAAWDWLDFFCWACGPKDDPRVVFRGVPDDLWTDQGPGQKHRASADLLERLDVNVVTGEAYAKERMGGVERSHRTRWTGFERALFLRGSETIRLSELNARLAEFEIRENARRPSRTPVRGSEASRTSAWTALAAARPKDNPLRDLPDNPLETLAREAPRRIDVNGIVRWRGEQYECADWHDRRVIARQALDGSGDLTLEDEATGERRTARRYRPRPYGEIRAVPATELEKLAREDMEAGGADVFAPSGEAPAVVPMPTRTAPAAPLDDPLDGGACRDLDEAMRLFAEIYPHPLTPANRALAIERVREAGLRRDAVTELALQLAALAREA